jgi:DME family drug/metabolite transporter
VVGVQASALSPLRARAGLLAVSGAGLLWGTTGVAVRIVHDRSGLEAVPIGCLRLAIATVALAVLFGRSGVRRARTAFARHRWALVLAGAGLGGYQALYFVGVQNAGVSVSTLVSLGVAPVTITVGTAVAGRRLPRQASLVTLAIGILGLTLVSLRPGHASAATHPLLGLLASIGSGLGYAATTVLNRRLAEDGDPLLLTWVTSGIGALMLLPIAIPMGLFWPSDGIAASWLCYIGIVPTVLAYGLFYLGLRSISSESAGILTLLEPLTAALVAALVLHESLSSAGAVGAALLLAAIAGLYLRRPVPL